MLTQEIINQTYKSYTDIQQLYAKGFDLIPCWKDSKKTVISWSSEKLQYTDIKQLWGYKTETRFRLKNGSPILGDKRFNVAIRTGTPIDDMCLFVIDCDLIKDKDKNPLLDQQGNGIDELNRLQEELGQLPPTLSQTTASGGKQYLFKAPKECCITTSKLLGQHIDTRGVGGIIIAPPSMISGKAYRWDNDYPITELPEMWRDYIMKADARKRFTEGYNKRPAKVKAMHSQAKTVNTIQQNEHIQAIINREPMELQRLIFKDSKPISRRVCCISELEDAIQQIDLREVLGYGSELDINCPFHEDTQPSATIFRNTNDMTGKEFSFFSCMGCGAKGSVLKVISNLMGEKDYRIIKQFLASVYGLEYIITKEQAEVKAIVEDFKVSVYNGTLKNDCPKLFNSMRYSINQYITFLDIMAMNFVGYNEDMPVFYESIRNLATHCDIKNIGMLNRRINHWALLELIYKLEDKEIPQDLLEHVKSKCNPTNNRMNVFACKLPTADVLQEAEERQELLDTLDFRSNSYTIEGIASRLGMEMVENIFPQMTLPGLEVVATKNDVIKEHILKFVKKKIAKSGYCLQSDIIGNKPLAKKCSNKTEHFLKMFLYEIQELLDIQCIKCNKEIKEKFSISSNGYPKIFIPN